MARVIFRRIAWAIPTLWLIVTISFFLMRAAPGGPFDLERPLDPIVMENLRRIYQFDEPLWRQYLTYVAGLGATALALAVVVGSAAGAFAASRARTVLDVVVTATASIGVTLPNFVVAPLLQLAFGLWLKVLPVGGYAEGAPRNLVLPIVVLAAPQVAAVARLTRAAMIEALAAPASRTLRAYGLPRRVVLAHAFRAALIPLVSYLGPAAAAVMTGSVVVETIFGIPGLGRYFVEAAINRDYTLAMGAVVLVALAIVVVNLIVDIAYPFIDPRIRLD